MQRVIGEAMNGGVIDNNNKTLINETLPNEKQNIENIFKNNKQKLTATSSLNISSPLTTTPNNKNNFLTPTLNV